MPFSSLKFRYSWRPYQQRVLDAIDHHLDDQRLHIVAAPGAGKTSLGLEVFRRLKKSALVLSPTRVIRDQWIDRLSDFCEVDSVSRLNWVSKKLDEPKVLTSITYQALHAQLSDELATVEDEAEALDLDDGVTQSELEVFIATLKRSTIDVIILDEAHHLRAQWWRALNVVCSELPDITLVSLTATPPYDAQANEWLRYEQLCGPIDEEISVPELVKAGTLCPHQDYIFAVDVSSSEKRKIEDYDTQVSTLCTALFIDQKFEDIVVSHPWLSDKCLAADVIKHPELAVALLAFTKEKRKPFQKTLLVMLDLNADDVPQLGRRWWQVLIEGVIFSNTFDLSDLQRDYVTQLKKQLRASELLYKRELSIERSRRLGRSLSQSISKVDACIDVHKLEVKQRGEFLRQVILVDYIRDEILVSGIDAGELNLGAWPIFQALTLKSDISERIGLLTGRLSIVHHSRLNKLLLRLGNDRFKVETIGPADRYRKVTGPLNSLTSAFTALLMDGDINTLVGTRALLGEGWDAPAINSLVLASSVGSFMLTNQMRGRAIRVDKAAPEKVSSIWHLVAIDDQSNGSGWSDFFDLKKRFNTFVGLSEKGNTIESGFERMAAAAFDKTKKMPVVSPVSVNNRQMLKRFRKIGRLANRWNQALTLDNFARVMPSINTPHVSSIRHFHLKNTLKYILMEIFGAVILFWVFLSQLYAKVPIEIVVIIVGSIVLSMLYKLPQTAKAVRILFKHLPVFGSLKQIGSALTEALCESDLIESSRRGLKVNVVNCFDGTCYLALVGGTFYESSIFADCLAEILAPIENPRYLIVRSGELYGLSRDDFHAVPMKLAVKKDLALTFHKAWEKHVGPSELIYTRTDDGRSRLVKAKMKAFSSTFSNDVKRMDRWEAPGK